MSEWILLEECYGPRWDKTAGKFVQVYLGKIVVHRDEINQILSELKADVEDKHGMKKYSQKLKDAGIDIEAASA